MNNKGFSLNDLLIGLGVMAFALILSTLLMQSKFKEVDSILRSAQGEASPSETIAYTYEDMEIELVQACTQYMDQKIADGVSYKESAKITMDTLVKAGLYTSTKDPKDSEVECEGYVIFQKKGATISYTPYLKCGKNYETRKN